MDQQQKEITRLIYKVYVTPGLHMVPLCVAKVVKSYCTNSY